MRCFSQVLEHSNYEKRIILDVNTDLGNRKYKSTLLACVQSSTVGLQKLKKKTFVRKVCKRKIKQVLRLSGSWLETLTSAKVVQYLDPC